MQGDEPEEIGEPAQPAVEVIHEGLQVAETVESHAPEVRLIEIEGSRPADGTGGQSGSLPPLGPRSTVGRLTESVVSVGIAGVRTAARASARLGRLVEASALGRIASDVAAGVTAAVADDGGVDWALAGQRAEERLSRVIAVVVPVVAESIDLETIVERLDVNALMEQVDIDSLLGRVDVNAMLLRVDVNEVLDRVDVNGLLDRIDVDALLGRADVDALLTRIDVDALIERVDIDGLMRRVELGNVLSRGTGEVAGSALDLARRQGVGLDVVLSRTVNRLIGRDPDRMPVGPEQLAPNHGGDDEAGST